MKNENEIQQSKHYVAFILFLSSLNIFPNTAH
jgi:hypothetical protein